MVVVGGVFVGLGWLGDDVLWMLWLGLLVFLVFFSEVGGVCVCMLNGGWEWEGCLVGF